MKAKALRCCDKFTNFVYTCNINCRLVFDHEAKTLDIELGQKKGEKFKPLSDGEHTFITASFLLSLWSIAESPFFICDEFDEFIDQINRNFALEPDRQYIFFMSHDKDNYQTNNKDVKLFKMSDQNIF